MDVGVISSETAQRTFTGADGNALTADIFEPRGDACGVALLLHGGGQTRHSWAGAGQALAADGWHVVSIDQRGHGGSAWDAEGDYSMPAFARDLVCVADRIEADYGEKPVVVGASLGGLAGMIAVGELAPDQFRALVLVDVTPDMKQDGVEKILGFMAANAEHGFASLEEAAEVIAHYLPHRPKPRDTSGLAKNLRLGDDGRFRWHWDPRFLESRNDASEHTGQVREVLSEVARRIALPVLLVRGRESELVGDEEAARFKALVPHAELADVSDARHMVAGDRNDVFVTAVRTFLEHLNAKS